MCKSLRVLTLGHLTDVEGKSQRIFEKLVFFSAEVSHLPFDVSKLKGFKELRHLCFKPADLQNLSQMPSNLRHIELNLNSPGFQISSNCIQQVSNLRVLKLRKAQLKRLPHELGDVVNGLRELRLSECRYLEELPESMSKLGSLRVLDLSYCSGLRQLPTDLGSLNYDLQELELSWCGRLEALPSSLENLTSLQKLCLNQCYSLKALPSNLGKLISLQELDLSCCESLEALPTSLEELPSLRLLNLSSCTSLKDLPYGIGKLTSLVNLELDFCRKLSSIPDSIGQLKLDSILLSEADLKELPDGFCSLSFITKLTMDSCHRLEKLPDRFGEATSLIRLSLVDCGNLKKLPESFSQLKYLEKLDLSRCTRLEELCTDFKCLSSLRVLSLKQCRVLKKLPESFGQLKCLEKLDLSFCESLEELCADFKCLSSLQDLSLVYCEVLKKLPEDFHFLTSLQTLYLTNCYMLEGKWMESMVKMKTLQVLVIRGSTLLEERWEEIQRQWDQSWSCAVHTRQGVSNKENVLKQSQSEFDRLLINERGEPVHISDLHPNTLLLVLFDGRDYFSWFDSQLSLIEESIDDIQANFVMVYFGKHFNELPKKVANKILGRAPANANAQALFQKLFVAAESYLSDSLDDMFLMSAKVVSDEKGYKYLSCWDLLTNKSAVEEFVLKNCRKYLKLKQLVESPRENHIELLRELFASGEEESPLVFLKNGALTQVAVKELKGKKILLDIRQASIGYDIPLLSLVEMYLAEKDRFNFEIITIPIIQPDTQLDICKKFSREVPWLVIQDPWQLTNATKYFLGEGSSLLFDEWDMWHRNRMRIIESNGTMAAYNRGGLLRMVNAWGTEAYPFTEEKYVELMEKEVREMKSMPILLFLFKHLESVSEQVKRAMREQKMICLYTSDSTEFTNSINNVLMEWSDSIYIICIPKFQFQRSQALHFPWKLSEMQGMSLLNLSEHEVMRFWARISSFKEVRVKKDDKDEELNNIYSLLNFIYLRKAWESYLWMVIMDEDGNLITEKGKEMVELLCEEHQNGKAKEWMKQFMKGTIESRKEILVELGQLSVNDDADEDVYDDDDADEDDAEDDADDDDVNEDVADDDDADEDARDAVDNDPPKND